MASFIALVSLSATTVISENIVSLKNYENNATVAEINSLLGRISETEKCSFEDISAKREWNVQESGEIASFIYGIGFDSLLNIKRPFYNLVRIIFCYDN